jgi:hypothetical protein
MFQLMELTTVQTGPYDEITRLRMENARLQKRLKKCMGQCEEQARRANKAEGKAALWKEEYLAQVRVFAQRGIVVETGHVGAAAKLALKMEKEDMPMTAAQKEFHGGQAEPEFGADSGPERRETDSGKLDPDVVGGTEVTESVIADSELESSGTDAERLVQPPDLLLTPKRTMPPKVTWHDRIPDLLRWLRKKSMVLVKEGTGSPPTTRRYTQREKSVAWLLRNLSPICYEYLKGEYPFFPVESVLREWAAQKKEKIHLALSWVDNRLVDYLNKWRRNNDLLGQGAWIPCTLALDATTATYNPIMAKTCANRERGYCFAWLMLPLNADLKDLVVGTIYHVTGRMDASVLERTRLLAAQLEACGFDVWDEATDGDTGVNENHGKFYDEWCGLAETLAEIVKILMARAKDGKPWRIPVSDILHFFKNARTRLAVTGKPVSLSGKLKGVTGAKMARLILGHRKGTQPMTMFYTPLSLLDDNVAIQAFRRENLIAVGSAGNVTATFFLTPLVALMDAMRFEAMTIETRLMLLEVAFTCFRKMLRHYEEMDQEREAHKRTRLPKGQKKTKVPREIWENNVAGATKLTLWTKNMCKRGCNLCVLVYWAIMRWDLAGRPFPLALGRIGTHSVECFFGMIRSLLRGDTRFELFESTEVRAVLARFIMQKLGIKQFKKRFANEGGCAIPVDDLRLLLPLDDDDDPEQPKVAGKIYIKNERTLFDNALNDLEIIATKIRTQQETKDLDIRRAQCQNIIAPFIALGKEVQRLNIHEKDVSYSPFRGIATVARFFVTTAKAEDPNLNPQEKQIMETLGKLADQ